MRIEPLEKELAWRWPEHETYEGFMQKDRVACNIVPALMLVLIPSQAARVQSQNSAYAIY
jgi:hypothetical protein